MVSKKIGAHSTPKQTHDIYQKLDEVLVRVGEGIVAYPGDMNDQSIADELKVLKAAVVRIRSECFGKVAPTPRQGSADELSKLVEQMRLEAKSDTEGLLKIIEEQQTMILNLSNTVSKLTRGADYERTRITKLIASLIIKGYHELKPLAAAQPVESSHVQ